MCPCCVIGKAFFSPTKKKVYNILGIYVFCLVVGINSVGRKIKTNVTETNIYQCNWLLLERREKKAFALIQNGFLDLLTFRFTYPCLLRFV